MQHFEPGSRFGDLEIERQLGHGSYGDVYLARDTLIERRVALKVLRAPSAAGPAERERILDEARLIGRMKGPHIATLFRVHPFPDGDGWVFEMEYVEGGSLHEQLGRDQRLPPDRVARIARGILSGLKEAHEHKVVHGDVKPGNVLFADDGTVKLVDFGLARLVGDLSLAQSAGADLIGTPVYMAPEVVMGSRPTTASDLWSTGVVLYRMLSGRMPFPGKMLPALFYAIQNAAPAALDAGLPAHLVELTMRCLSKSAAERPASCEEALADLEPRSVAEGPHRVALPQKAGEGRLFGRQAERDQLHAAAHRATQGHGTTVLLTGDGGAGKSALALELVSSTAPQGFRWVESRVTALDGFLRPLLSGVRDLLGAAEDSEPRLRQSKLFGTATHLLRALVEGESVVRIESRQQILWGASDLLARLADTQPLGVLINDMHLADAEDWKLLDEIARRLDRSRVLLVVTLQANAPPPELAARAGAQHIHVGPLEPDAVMRLLHERAAGAQVAPEVLHRILDVAEGNPLFTIELFRHLQESRAVITEKSRCRPGPAWSATTLPRRIRDLVLVRLRGLPEEQRSLLDVAAVDGVAFDGEDVAAVSQRPLLEVLRALQEIYRATGLVVPRTKGYRFANAFLQEGIYEQLAPDLRRALHGHLASHLEAQAERGPVAPERLGLHWERAGDVERARPHLRRAARDAVQRQDLLRAIDLLERAGLAPAALRPEAAAEHATLLLDVTGCYAALGRFADAELLFDRLEAGAEAKGDERLSLEVLVRRSHQRYRRQGLAGIDEAALDRAAGRLPRSEHKGRALYLLGLISKYRGDLDEARRRFEEADAEFVDTHPGMHSSALDQLGSVCLRHGQWREAEALYADAARISARAGRRPNAAVSEINRAVAAFHRGALDGLAEQLERSIGTLALEGAATQVAGARALLGQVRYALGDKEAAARCFDEALQVTKRASYLGGYLASATHRAELFLIVGDLDSARAVLGGARRLAAQREDYQTRMEIGWQECHTACFLGETAQACASARQTLRLVADTPALSAHEALLVTLAEAVLHGLPGDLLDEIEALLSRADAGGSPCSPLPRLVCAGARALTEPSHAAGALREAADALRGPGVGPRRATLRLFGARLAAEGKLRAGDRPAARAEAEAALVDAARLGHVWMEAHFLTFLARGTGPEQDRLARHVLRLATRLADEQERALLVRRWLPGYTS